MDKSKYRVHATHCCIIHGCKYGDEDCPVESGEVKQEYICEWCDENGIESLSELENHQLSKRLLNAINEDEEFKARVTKLLDGYLAYKSLRKKSE